MPESIDKELKVLLSLLVNATGNDFDKVVTFFTDELVRQKSTEEKYKNLYTERSSNIEAFRYFLAQSLAIKLYLENDLNFPETTVAIGASIIFSSLLPAKKMLCMLHSDNELFNYISDISNDNISSFLTTFGPKTTDKIMEYDTFQNLFNKIFTLVKKEIESYSDIRTEAQKNISNYNSLIETYNFSRYAYDSLKDFLEYDFDYITNAMSNVFCFLFHLPYDSKNKNMIKALIQSNGIMDLKNFLQIKEVYPLTNTTTNELFGYEVIVSTMEPNTTQEAIEETAIIYPNGTLYETPGCAKSIISLLKLKLDKLFCFYDNNNEEPLKEDEYFIWSKKGEVLRLKRGENIYPNEAIANVLNILSQEELLEL